MNKCIDVWDECLFITDSEFWINMIEKYMDMWSKNGIDFTTKKNSDLTIPLHQLYNKLLLEGKIITFKHIRSHQTIWKKMAKDSYEYYCGDQNEYVDKTANYAREHLLPGTHTIGKIEYM